MNARILSGALALLVLIAALPISAAKSGAPPSAELPTLWAHRDASFYYWLSTTKGDQGHAGSAGYNSLGWTGNTLDTLEPEVGNAYWDLVLDPGLDAPVQIAAGNIEFVIYAGSTTSANGNPVATPTHAKFSVSLTSGSTVVASKDDATVHSLEAQTWKEVKIAVPVPATTIPAGQALTWHIKAVASPPFLGFIFLGMADPNWSHLTLPFGSSGLPAGTPSLNADVTSASAAPGSTATYELQASSTANDTYTISTSGLPEGYGVTIEPASGTLSSTPTNVTLKVAVPAGAPEGKLPFQVIVDTGAANASLALELVVDAAATATPAPTSSTTPATTASSGTTATGGASSTSDGGVAQSEEPDKKSGIPGFELAFIALALLGVLAARRRRA